MKPKKDCVRKLRSRRGESIAEVLIALLITAMGMAVLAGMISSASKIVQNSEDAVKTFIQAENSLAAQSGTRQGGQALMEFDNQSAAPITIEVFASDSGNGTLLYSYK